MAAMTTPQAMPDLLAAMRRDVHEAVRQLHLARAISFARPGTVSLRLLDGAIALASLQIADDAETRLVSILDAAGTAGAPNSAVASAEVGAIHAAVLAARPAAKAVLVFRGHYLTAWAVGCKPIPVRYFQMLNYTKAPELPVAILDRPGNVTPLLEVMAAHPDSPCVLLSNGDVVTWSSAIVKAARLAISLDEAAQVTAIAERLGGAKPYPSGIPESIYAALAPYS